MCWKMFLLHMNLLLSYEVASESLMKPYIKNDKQLVD